MIPTATELLYFIEVYQVRHVSRAAIRLGITQPTLTQSLRRLEEKLKATLFIRTKLGVIPTAQAALFYHRAQALKDNWNEIEGSVHESLSEIAGDFMIGCHQSVGAFTIPQLLDRLAENAPKISIKLTHDSSRRITEKVVSYQIDLGYVVNPPRHGDLILKQIGEDQVKFWRKKGSNELPKRLFADGNRDRVEQLLGKTYKKYFRDWALISTSSLELIRTMTRKGLGVGVLPERVANADASDLVLYDKSLPFRHDEIYVAYRREVLRSKAGKELVRLASFQL